MREELAGLLEQADLALASCRRVVPEGSLIELERAVAAVRTRLSYPDDVVVAALAGGTGSGKSSLFNAVVGEEIADTGGIRPTTSTPLAGVPTHHAGAMERYLDLIGVDRRHHHDHDRLCLLDLPDTDSVEVEHRHRVDELLGRVDLVVWVVDPEKYRDARFHHEYLRPLAPYAAQFIFALNQIDRLDEGDLEAVIADLEAALSEDGIEGAVVVSLAAAPRFGPPVGLERLMAVIERRLASDAIYEKLLVDMETTARALEEHAGAPLDFDRRAADVIAAAAGHLGAGDDRAASRELLSFLDDLADEAGRPAAEGLFRLAGQVPAHVLRIVGQARIEEPRRRRPWRRREPGHSVDQPLARRLLAEAVIRPARAALANRAVALADVAALALEVSRVRQQARR